MSGLRYFIWYKPKYSYEPIIEDQEHNRNFKWQWIPRHFISVRAAIRWARVNRIFTYFVYPAGSVLHSDYIFIKGHNG